VRIFCDLASEVDTAVPSLIVHPIETDAPVPARSGMTHISAQGIFASESRFYPADGQTRIAYRLRLSAALPPPFGLRIIPDAILDHIAATITNGRVDEIVQGFITRSIAAFSQWQAANDGALQEVEVHDEN